jgi:hypothetical protein
MKPFRIAFAFLAVVSLAGAYYSCSHQPEDPGPQTFAGLQNCLNSRLSPQQQFYIITPHADLEAEPSCVISHALTTPEELKTIDFRHPEKMPTGTILATRRQPRNFIGGSVVRLGDFLIQGDPQVLHALAK